MEAGVSIAVRFPRAVQRPRPDHHRTGAAWSFSLAVQSTVLTRVGRQWHNTRPLYYTTRYETPRFDDFTRKYPMIIRDGAYRDLGKPSTY